MSTPNLAIAHIAASQNQKEVTANDAFDALDQAICGLAAISLTGATSPLVLAITTALRSAVLQLDPTHPGGSFDVVLPNNQKPYTVRNLSGGPVVVRTGGGTGVTVADGEVRLLYVDGTDVVDLPPAAAGGVAALDELSDVDTSTAPPASGDGLRWTGSLWVPASRGLDVGVFVPDRPDAGALVFKLVVVRACTLPAGLTGSRGHAGAAATARADFDIRQNGSSVGTARFAAGSATATFILATALSLAEGDRLELVAPSPQDTSTLVDILTTGGRFGGGAIRLRTGSTNQSLTKTLAPPWPATLVLGAALMLEPDSTAGPADEDEILELLDSGGVVHLTLTWSRQDQLLRAYRGTRTGTLLDTSSQTLAPAAWAFMETKATVADSGGSIEVRLDGASVLSFTGDTRNAGTAEIATIRFSSHFVRTGNRYLLRLDDAYLCDTTGSLNNDLLGDVRIVTLRPTADTVQADFTPLGGAAHYLEVDDAPDDDGDASYVESATVGHQDRFAYADLAATPAAIVAVQVAIVARKDDAGSRSLRALIRSGATTANGATRVLGTSYALYDDRFETDPATGAAWTKAGVDALEAGLEVVA